VYSVEIIEELASKARLALDATGFQRVQTRVSDGYRGWEEESPFDAIVVTAMPSHLPEPLVEQLVVGGRLVIPVEERLLVVTKTQTATRQRFVLPVRFVPMTGEAQGHGLPDSV
jgi:protein-L-isoaspartate(D-aspartate) O-methyltransferase